MALSLPGPDTLDAGIISKRWRNIERSSLEGSVSKSYSHLPLKAHDIKVMHTQKGICYRSTFMCSQMQIQT